MAAPAAPQRCTNAGSTKPMPDAPLSIIGCTGLCLPHAPCTLPCTLSSAVGSVRAPCSSSGGLAPPRAVLRLLLRRLQSPVVPEVAVFRGWRGPSRPAWVRPARAGAAVMLAAAPQLPLLAAIVDIVEPRSRRRVTAAATFGLPVGCARVGLQLALRHALQKPPPRRAA